MKSGFTAALLAVAVLSLSGCDQSSEKAEAAYVSENSSASLIICKSTKNDEVTVTLNSLKKFSTTLSCIAGNFISDMTACAPNGGYGLSYPTGSASLSKVVTRWQDYGDHLGGVVDYSIDYRRIHFSGGWMSNSGYTDYWAFNIDRVNGNAVLNIIASDIYDYKAGETKYQCEAASQKF